MVDCFLLSCSSACMRRLTTFRDDIKSSPKRENRVNFSRISIDFNCFVSFPSGKCAFLHTKTQSHFLLRHSFLQFFKGIVLVFHRSFVVRTFESCRLAFVTQMKPFFLGCLLSFDYFVWITFQNSKRYFTHTVGSSRFKLQLAK